jgi:hypothetical protein
VFARLSAVVQHFGVVAAVVLQRIGEDRKTVECLLFVMPVARCTTVDVSQDG